MLPVGDGNTEGALKTRPAKAGRNCNRCTVYAHGRTVVPTSGRPLLM